MTKLGLDKRDSIVRDAPFVWNTWTEMVSYIYPNTPYVPSLVEGYTYPGSYTRAKRYKTLKEEMDKAKLPYWDGDKTHNFPE